ncbi:O-antigen ligase family protein [Flavobacterium xanthum]|nr:O-antigen ligase family protein [Flavobacterium xanthum]
MALAAVNSIISFTPATPQFIYYGFMLILLFLGISKSNNRISFLIIWLLIASGISLALNDIAEYYNPLGRFLVFLLGILVLSPMLRGTYINQIKIHLFKYTNIFLLLITFLSFLGKITAAYSVYDYASLFSGITTGSMIMAPIAGVSLLICCWKIYEDNIHKRTKYYFIILATTSLFCLILAGSRAALMGALLAVLFLFMKLFRGRLTKMVQVLVFILFVLAVTSPIWLSYTETLTTKMEFAESQGDQFSSRADLWDYRIQEFTESPVFGIGFANSHYGLIDTATGNVEPGTSWGAILAMVGLLGAMPFLILIFRFLFHLYFDKINKLNSAFLLGILIFFIVHWFAEGYMLAAGSFLFFYAWLSLGVMQVYKDTKKIVVL